MNSQSVFNVFQTLTGLAVLVGLVLVILELQQSRELARAQLTADGWEASMDFGLAVLGENFADVYVKACLTPQELNEAEIYQMDAHFWRWVDALRRRNSYEHIGEGKVFGQEAAVQDVMRGVLQTQYGRVEYGKRRAMLPIWLTEPSDALLEKGEYPDCRNIFRDHLHPLGKDAS